MLKVFIDKYMYSFYKGIYKVVNSLFVLKKLREWMKILFLNLILFFVVKGYVIFSIGVS